MHLSSLPLFFDIDHLTSPPPLPIQLSSKLDNSLMTWPNYGQPCVKLICSYIIHFSFLCHMSSCQTHSYNNFHVFTPCSILVAVQRDRCTVRSVVMLSLVRNDTSDLQALFLVCVYFMSVSLVCWTMSQVIFFMLINLITGVFGSWLHVMRVIVSLDERLVVADSLRGLLLATCFHLSHRVMNISVE